MATNFETETCGRCGGCGRYSYCQMYGDTCFKCHGKGKVYTKRGLLAKLYYDRLASKPAGELKVGDVIWNDPGPFTKGGWSTILDIKRDTTECQSNGSGWYCVLGGLTIETKGISHGGVLSTTMMRVRQTPEQVAAKMELAISYQRSLTKSGKIDTKLAKLMSQIAYA